MSFEYEDLDRVERKGYALGFAAGYSLFSNAVSRLISDLEKDRANLEQTPAFKEFQARWTALLYTGCDLVEEASRQDANGLYRDHEDLELKEIHESLDVELSPDAREKLEALAKEKGRTVSELVSEIILENTKPN